MQHGTVIGPREHGVHPRWRELNAFTYLDPGFEAEIGQSAAGEWATTDTSAATGAPPLAGCRIAVKDNIEVAGMPCTLATPTLRNYIPVRDATAVARLRGAGARIVGKANMHELAYGITSNNPTFGPVRNVHDLSCFAGGSSGGTAAAIAAGLVHAGLGTDTGGSSRIPAALCGIVGFRPTVGRYPMDGVALLSPTRDVIGPMGRTVRDVAALDAVLAGIPSTGFDAGDLRGLKIGVPQEHFQENLHPDVFRALQRTVAALRDAGATLVSADVKDIAAVNAAVSFPVVLHETRKAMETYLRHTGMNLTLARLYDGIASADVKEILDQVMADAVPEHVYRQALTVARPQLQRLYEDYFGLLGIEVVLLPTTPLPAQPIDGSERFITLNGAAVPTFATFIRNTDPASNAGIPGISLPAGFSARQGREPTALPVAIELDGPAGSDRRLLAIAAAVEAALS